MLPAALETPRLVIRPFVEEDLLDLCRIQDPGFTGGSREGDAQFLAEQRSWLQWSRLNAEWFPKMDQTTYGDRAVVLKTSGRLIGSVGYVPMHGPFHRIPGLAAGGAETHFNTLEFGLFWMIDAPFRRQGYATEAAGAMLEKAFLHLGIRRILATTGFDNHASQAVMRKLGMQVERNPIGEPEWLQVVGWMQNPG